jgi:hypothetical protein
MPVSLKILVFLCSTAFFGTFLFLAKRGAVKPFYSTLWLLVSVLMLSLAILEKQYKSLADELGIRDASFLVFVGAILFMLVYILHLSLKISELSDRMQEIISNVSILEQRLRRVQASSDAQSGTGPALITERKTD